MCLQSKINVMNMEQWRDGGRRDIPLWALVWQGGEVRCAIVSRGGDDW